ncbi:MAG: CoA transferase [Meiothermus sp.]
MSALAGLKVLDLSRVLAGPYCTQTLADLGAEVWKLEPFWGDETRAWGPPFIEPDEYADWKVGAAGESAYYLSVNRGKKSVAVNLKDLRGQEIVRRLASRADVLLENYKVGDLARYGLDYETLRKLNPRLVYCSITGFGQTGPRASEPGYDAALQGYTGIMSVTGETDGPPMKVGVAWIDLLTGITATNAILAALLEREKSGQGQYIDLSLFDVSLAAMANLAQSYLVTGKAPMRKGNAHAQIVPYGAFPTSDGWIVLAVGNDSQYQKLCETIGRAELWADERFRTNPGRVTHRDELIAKLSEITKTQSKSHWLSLLQAAGVPCAPVNDLEGAFADPQTEARKMRQELEHPTLGSVPMVGSPLAFLSRTPAKLGSHPPLLGEHTLEVLTGVLGLSEKQVSELERAQVIRTAKH